MPSGTRHARPEDPGGEASSRFSVAVPSTSEPGRAPVSSAVAVEEPHRRAAGWHLWDDESTLVVPVHLWRPDLRRHGWSHDTDIEAVRAVSPALADSRHLFQQTAFLGASMPRSVFVTPISKRIIEYYRAIGDLGRTTPLVPPVSGLRPTEFVTHGLRKMRRIALGMGGSGLSQSARRELWDATVSLEREGLRDTGKVGPMESAFPTPDAFVKSLQDESQRVLSVLGWRITTMMIRGKTRYFYSRNLLSVMQAALEGASEVQLCSTRRRRSNGTRVRTGSLDSDLYMNAESEVLRIHGHRGRVMTVAVQLFSDVALVSWSKCKCRCAHEVYSDHWMLELWIRCCSPRDGLLTCLVPVFSCAFLSFSCTLFADHHVYPVRIRFPNIMNGKSGWLTVGYIPCLPHRNASTKADKVKMRTVRDRLLQRCLAVLLNDLISASETGVHCDLSEHGRVLALPRVVLYASDQPEERHVLGLQGNRCAYPCSACMTTPDRMGSHRSQCAPRCPLTNLELQMEGTLLVDSGGGRQRLAHITQQTSALPFLPVLGAMHGLGTGEMALYQVFGLDLLHVSSLLSFLSEAGL